MSDTVCPSCQSANIEVRGNLDFDTCEAVECYDCGAHNLVFHIRVNSYGAWMPENVFRDFQRQIDDLIRRLGQNP